MKKLLGSIGVRLTGTYLFIAALALVVGLVGYVQIERVNDMLAYGTAERAEARYLSTKIRFEVTQVSGLVESAVLADSEAARMRLATQFGDELVVLGEFVNRVQDYAPASVGEREMLDEIVPLLQEYLEKARAVMDDPASAELLVSFQSTRAQLVEKLAAFENQETSLLYVARREARTAVEQALATTILLSVVALVGGVFFGGVISASITRPVRHLVEAAQRIAGGDLEHRARVQSQDEIGALGQAFNEMAAQLQEMIRNLAQSEARYRGLFEGMPVGLYRTTPAGRIVDANPALLQILGYPDRETLLAVNATDLYVDGGDRQRWRALFETEGTVRDFDAQFRRHDGAVIEARNNARAVRGDGAETLYYEGSLEDVTERKRMEQELRRHREHLEELVAARTAELEQANEQLLQQIAERKRAEEALRRERNFVSAILETAGALVVVLDREGRIVRFNRACERTTGYLADEVQGQLLWDLFLTPGELEQVRRVFDHVQAGLFPSVYENYWRTRTEELRLIEWANTVLLDSGGAVEYVIGTGIDITERRLAEEERQQYAAQLEEANSELAQYAYVVSHDVRAPLRAIHNYADFLGEDLAGTLGEEQREYLDGLQRAVGEAEELVEDLLELSRVGRRSAPVEEIDVGLFLQEMLASLGFPPDVEIVMADSWPVLQLEPLLLRQIMQNLIGNAVKFNKSSSRRVELGWLALPEGGYELFVRDNGIGIAPRHHEQIFRVFERLHTREEYDGTGIGLAIVRKAVGKLGGSIRLESKLGEGSTFYVRLPTVQEER